MDAAGRIGFLDFEEDPGEIMPLHEAQARDWMIFAAGVVRHVPGRERVLARVLAAALPRVPERTRECPSEAMSRLAFLEPLTRRLGPRADGLGLSVAALRVALASGSAALRA